MRRAVTSLGISHGGLGALAGPGLLLCLSAGCSFSEPYWVPRKAAEVILEVQPNARAGALVPALRAKDREPVTLRYRHLHLEEATLRAALADPPSGRPAEYLRVRASKSSPFLQVGGVILGMGVVHLALGVGAAVDQPTFRRDTFSDGTGALLTMILGGLHLVAGGALMVYGEKNPTVEPAERSLIDPYIRGEIPTATAEEAPQAKPVTPSQVDVKNSDEGSESERPDR